MDCHVKNTVFAEAKQLLDDLAQAHVALIRKHITKFGYPDCVTKAYEVPGSTQEGFMYRMRVTFDMFGSTKYDKPLETIAL